MLNQFFLPIREFRCTTLGGFPSYPRESENTTIFNAIYYELEYMTKMLSERLKYIYSEFPMRLEIHEKYSTVDEQDEG